MTLKEKVAEVEPECIGGCFLGGVIACPGDHKYLNSNEVAMDCRKSDCAKCWNQQYIPSQK